LMPPRQSVRRPARLFSLAACAAVRLDRRHSRRWTRRPPLL